METQVRMQIEAALVALRNTLTLLAATQHLCIFWIVNGHGSYETLQIDRKGGVMARKHRKATCNVMQGP